MNIVRLAEDCQNEAEALAEFLADDEDAQRARLAVELIRRFADDFEHLPYMLRAELARLMRGAP